MGMPKNKISVADLEAFMKRHRLTPKALSELLGVTGPAVDHWLQGRRDVPPTTVKLFRTFDKYPGLVGEF